MGWKASIIIAKQHLRPHLDLEQLSHNAEAAKKIAQQLPGVFEYLGESNLDNGLYPNSNELYIGSYGQSLILGHQAFCQSCIDPASTPPIILAINQLLPDVSIMALELISTVNHYGYSLFENTRHVRSLAGSADSGVDIDHGTPCEEEQILFDKVIVNEQGARVWRIEFDGVVEEMDHSCLGEDFAFDVSQRLLIDRLDAFDHRLVKMSVFRCQRRSFWKRLFR